MLTMKNFGSIGLILLVMALAVMPATAQTNVPFTKTAALTATNASCTATACVQMPVTSATNTVGVQIWGTFSGTVSFEGTVNGSTWVAVAGAVPAITEARVITATAAGMWQINVAGYAAVRVRCSAFTSGTINVVLNRSAATPGNGT
jgi:hypothetical protein